MHISGKILAWFVVIGGGAAIFLSAKTLAVRRGWMEQAQKNEAAFRQKQEQVATKTRQLSDARGNLARTMLGWDRYWADVTGIVNPQGGLQLSIGSGHGVQPEQLLYVFAVTPDGKSTYVGDFKVANVADAQCAVRPNWRVRQGDISVAAQFACRVRTMVPSQYQSRLAVLDQQLLAAEQLVASNQVELERQAQIIARAEALIGERLKEINGDPALQGKPLEPVHIEGLLTSMIAEEELRNTALREADDLARLLKKTRERFERILADNKRASEKLSTQNRDDPAVGARAQ
jgi:hypothetical protein